MTHETLLKAMRDYPLGEAQTPDEINAVLCLLGPNQAGIADLCGLTGLELVRLMEGKQ